MHSADEVEDSEIMPDPEGNLCKEISDITRKLENYKNLWQTIGNKLQDELCHLASALGEIICTDLLEDGRQVLPEYRDLDNVLKLNARNWTETRNKCLVAFLSSSTSTKLEESSQKKINGFTHLIEQTLYVRHMNLVTPFAFQRNLVMYSLTQSKNCVKLTNAWEPAGGYTTVQNVLAKPSDPPKFPVHDADVTADNNQKVAKTSGRIKEGSVIPVSICTSLGYIQTHPFSDLQKRSDLKPGVWLNKRPREFIINDVNLAEEKHIEIFRQYRCEYIADIMQRVVKEHDDFRKQDYVDIAISQKQQDLNTIVCRFCQSVYLPNDNSYVCTECTYDPKNFSKEYDPYHRTVSNHPEEPPDVTVGEPCMVNPNSMKNIKKVLHHVYKISGIEKGDREWVTFWSDGIPYLYGSRLQDTFYICQICFASIDTTEVSLEQHAANAHRDSEVSFRPEFDYVAFRPGPGHIELNMARALLSFLWVPFLGSFVQELGFRTNRAKEVVKAGIDHHRSRQILEATLEALSYELLVPYVRHTSEPSTSGYFTWLTNEVKDPVYFYLFDVCFTFLLAFHLYTEATRKNNHSFMMGARVAFAPLFFARNHPNYRELHLRDMCTRVQYPTDLAKHMTDRESFSVSGVHNKGQGADFIQEELNKLIKSFLPPGISTSSTWTRVSRNASKLKKIKELAFQTSSVATETEKRPKKHDIEICMMRRLLRSKMITPQLVCERNMRSLTNEDLDPALANFKMAARKTYEQYKQNFVSTGKYGGVKLEPVFITLNDRQKFESIDSKTNAEIKELLFDILSKLPDRNLADELKIVHKDFNNVKKQNLLELFHDFSSVLQQQLAATEVELANEEI